MNCRQCKHWCKCEKPEDSDYGHCTNPKVERGTPEQYGNIIDDKLFYTGELKAGQEFGCIHYEEK